MKLRPDFALTPAHTPIFTSMLESDLYKISMWQLMLHKHPGTQAEYRFVCRNRPDYPLAELLADLNEQLDMLCALRFKEDELGFIGGLRWISADFVDFLRIFQFQRRFIEAKAVGDTLEIVARGPIVHTTYFEIFVLAIVNELYFARLTTPEVLESGVRILENKIEAAKAQLSHIGPLANPFEFFDFGLRRRHSGPWQRVVVEELMRSMPQYFRGTSNMLIAKETGLTPIGTHGHEVVQMYMGLGVRLRDFQRAFLEDWAHEFRGELGIALTDVVGMRAFLSDFDRFFALLFSGLRHDSGDAKEWGELALAHYAKLRIDTRGKRLVFSDGLDLPKAIDLHAHFSDRIQIGCGIGTNLTNDLGVRPLNIVMKLVRCNGQPVAKLSDTPGKTLCDDETFLAYLRQVFAIAP